MVHDFMPNITKPTCPIHSILSTVDLRHMTNTKDQYRNDLSNQGRDHILVPVLLPDIAITRDRPLDIVTIHNLSTIPWRRCRINHREAIDRLNKSDIQVAQVTIRDFYLHDLMILLMSRDGTVTADMTWVGRGRKRVAGWIWRLMVLILKLHRLDRYLSEVLWDG